MGCVCGKEDLEIGGRRFEILRQIGEGGFSVVYLVQEVGVKGRYAVKKITCHSSREKERTKREIELHEKLGSHPNILSLEAHSFEKASTSVVYQQEEALSDSVDAFLVFPFYKKGTLLDELASRSAQKEHYSEKHVLELFLGILNAVRQFHRGLSKPYAHRDIKTGNVLLGEDNSPVLMDFGSAAPARLTIRSSKEAKALEEDAAEHSTMTYRPPEFFNVEVDAEIDERSDIWSLGCLLYALCFFISPFDAVHERGDSVALAAASGKFQIPESSPYSEDLHQLIALQIQTDPSQRPSVETVIERTEEIMAKLPKIPDAEVV